MTQPTTPIAYPENVSIGPMFRIDEVIRDIACDIASVRKTRGLTSLVCPSEFPTAPIMVGEEWVRREQSPPRIILVPTTIRTEAAIRMGQQPMTGKVSQSNPRPFGEASSGSTPTSGASRTRPASTHCGTSTAPSNSTGSFSAPLLVALATSPMSRRASKRLAGSSRRRTDALGANSSYRGRSRSTSPTSRGSCSRTRPARRWAFRSTRPCKWTGPTGLRQPSASSSRRRPEVGQ